VLAAKSTILAAAKLALVANGRRRRGPFVVPVLNLDQLGAKKVA
jgi:hypothetical protein